VEFRLYQKRIADVASERNTLVILPTALGKTVISALVAANILYNYRDAKILVMAPTRPLVVQHRETFLKILKLREKDTAVLTGRTPADRRTAFWQGEARIFFSTPQVVRNDLLEGRLNLEKGNEWKNTPAIWLDAKTCAQLAERLKNIAAKL
jgi:Fanconi anemia group M protein